MHTMHFNRLSYFLILHTTNSSTLHLYRLFYCILKTALLCTFIDWFYCILQTALLCTFIDWFYCILQTTFNFILHFSLFLKKLSTSVLIPHYIPYYLIFNRLSRQGSRGGAGADPSRHWAKAGYTLDRSPVYHRADTQRQTAIHSHIHTYGQFRVNN